MRKLGFEETPDYDFLRDLFTKALKNNNDVDDQVYDWNLLNGGRGWESQVVRASLLQQIPNYYNPYSFSNVAGYLRIFADPTRAREAKRRTWAPRRRTETPGFGSTKRCRCTGDAFACSTTQQLQNAQAPRRAHSGRRRDGHCDAQ